jgi:hypothetical protein
MANVGIKQGWSLLAFASGKKMQVGSFVNSETGEQFKSCVFTEQSTGNRCFVAFSSNLGELTPAQISAMKHELQVVELNSGNFSLCKQGQGTWEDVEL